MPIPNKNITNPNKLVNTENNFKQISSDKNKFVPEESEPQQQELDAVDEIRRYYELKEDGIISEEEFNQKKKQLLNL